MTAGTDYISASSSAVSGNFTVSAWYKANSTPNAYPNILGIGSASNWKNKFGLHLFSSDTDDIRFGCTLDGVWTKADGDEAVGLDNWYNVVGVYSGSQMKLYINGDLITTLNVSGTLTDYGAPLTIGADIESNDPCYFFDGMVDEITIAYTVRNESWISAAYDNINAPASFVQFGTKQSAVMPALS